MEHPEFATRFDFSIPEAQWLSDLNGVHSDLKAVNRICLKVRGDAEANKSPTSADGVSWFEQLQYIADLFSSAVIRYGRALGSGVRKGVPAKWIESLPEELQSDHRYFKDLRDKSIAHSVNPLEDNQVFVWVADANGESPTVKYVTVASGRYLPGGNDADRLLRLSESLVERVESEIVEETAKLLEIAKNMPVRDIINRGSDELPIPSTTVVGKKRRRFHE